MTMRWKAHLSATSPIPARQPNSFSPTRIAFLLLKDASTLTEAESAWTRTILDRCPGIDYAREIVQRFLRMLRDRSARRLTSWFNSTTKATVPSPIRTFALGLKKDWPAIVAAFTTKWSNGLAEGHISRLKMLKRQMYGRARFDLLRKRYLAKV